MISQIPSNFVCHLTGQIMINPVIDKNGNNYENNEYE